MTSGFSGLAVSFMALLPIVLKNMNALPQTAEAEAKMLKRKQQWSHSQCHVPMTCLCQRRHVWNAGNNHQDLVCLHPLQQESCFKSCWYRHKDVHDDIQKRTLLPAAHGWQTHQPVCLPVTSTSYSCARYSSQDSNIQTCAALYRLSDPLFPWDKKRLKINAKKADYVKLLQGKIFMVVW